MNKTIIIIIIAAIALTAGVGGAYAVSRVIPVNQNDFSGVFDGVQPGEPTLQCEIPGKQGFFPWGSDSGKYPGDQPGNDCMRPDDRSWMGPGMMGKGRFFQDPAQQGERISIDEAFEAAQEYVSGIDENLRVVEVMEFSQNFYAVVLETDTDRGAVELLIDPQTASVGLEIGPTRMWNTKYGHMRMRVDELTDNALTIEDAAAAAQAYLDAEINGAVVEADGIDFYGYYSFDYKIDNEVAGMLSVNGTSGQVWLHTWHGTFIAEKEMDE